jgi:Uma2 family endonuclease
MPEMTKDVSIARFLPATLIPDTPLSNNRLETFACRTLDVERIRCERYQDGNLRMYPPTPEAIWLMVTKIHAELILWLSRTSGDGQAAIRRRFFLDDPTMMCPDVAYVAPRYKRKQVDINAERILEICPSFVVEVCSHPRELRSLKDKMLRWIASGVELGWLVVPQEECIFVYLPGSEPEIVEQDFAFGEGPIEDFFIFLDEIWRFDAYKRRY